MLAEDLALREHPVEDHLEAALAQPRQRVEERLEHHLLRRAIPQAACGRVCDLDHVVAPAQHHHRIRRLLQQPHQVFPVAAQVEMVLALARESRFALARIGAPRRSQRQVRANLGDQLAGRERFHEVVVRSRGPSLAARLFAGTSRQHHHRQIAKRRVGPHRLQQSEAVQARHHDVGHEQVERRREERVHRRFAIRHGDHFPFFREQPHDVLAHVGVVFGDEESIARGVGGADVLHLAGAWRAKPVEGFLHEWPCAARRRLRGGIGDDLLRRQVRRAPGDRHREQAAFVGLAFDADRAAMHAHQLVDHREPDPGAFVRA